MSRGKEKLAEEREKREKEKEVREHRTEREKNKRGIWGQKERENYFCAITHTHLCAYCFGPKSI